MPLPPAQAIALACDTVSPEFEPLPLVIVHGADGPDLAKYMRRCKSQEACKWMEETNSSAIEHTV